MASFKMKHMELLSRSSILATKSLKGLRSVDKRSCSREAIPQHGCAWAVQVLQLAKFHMHGG
jgi:hypothetical protein